MEMKIAHKVKGNNLTTTSGTGSASTVVTLVETDGEVIGVSVAENYATVDMGKIALTIQQGDDRPFQNVPASQLLPTSNRAYYPLAKPLLPANNLDVTVVSNSANTLAANPVNLILHFAPKSKAQSC